MKRMPSSGSTLVGSYLAAECEISLEGDFIVMTFTPFEGREDWFMEMINDGKWGSIFC